MKRFILAVLLVAPLLLAPMIALAQDVDIEFDEGANFSTFKTFRIVNQTVSAKAPALNNELVKKKIEGEIRKRLTAKGLKEVTAQQDLGVRYNLGANPRTDVTTIPAGRLGRQRRVVRDQYTEGTLIIDLRSRLDQELVWRAIVSEDEKNPAKIEGRLDEMVKKAFDKYPPKK
ncbi:MAG: DUF4136 domain-containing protein [Acidobacteriota bacterium]